MTSAVVYKKDAAESFNSFNPVFNLSGGRPIKINYRFDSKGDVFKTMEQGLVVGHVKADSLISQAQRLRHRYFWRLWGLRAPDRRVIESTINVIRYCPSEFLLDGYCVDNYGNGTVVMTKRSPNYMVTINIGKSALSFAKLSIKDHKVVYSGHREIESESIAELFSIL